MANDLIVADPILADVEVARQALARCSTIPQAKQIADVASAAEIYARRNHASKETISHITAVRVDALTLLGGFLRGTELSAGARGSAGPGREKRGCAVQPRFSPPPTLASYGLDKFDSFFAQGLLLLHERAPDLHKQVRDAQLAIRPALARFRRLTKKAAEADFVKELEAALDAADSRFTIDLADCLDWFAARSADSVHLVFGSPPYEQARTYQEGGEDYGIARNTDAWVAWMVEVYKVALRCCNGLVAFVVEGQTKKYRWSVGPALLMAALHKEGIHLRKPPIYHRVGIPGSGGPDWLRNDYEFIVCATRGGKLPWSDNTAMGEPCKYEPGGDPSHREKNGRRVNAESGPATMADRGNVGHHRARYQAGSAYEPPEIANPGNVITCVAGGGNMGDKLAHDNEAPFPEALAEFFVRSFCPPGGIVCDPFSGSGTTGAMAIRHGRRFAGCDLRPSQVDLSLRRIARVEPFLPFVEESQS